jgi:hypothetical protein
MMSNDRQQTLLALALLDSASHRRTIGIAAINAERGLLHLRLNDVDRALSSFESYVAELGNDSSGAWREEILWAKRMVGKCRLKRLSGSER